MKNSPFCSRAFSPDSVPSVPSLGSVLLGLVIALSVMACAGGEDEESADSPQGGNGGRPEDGDEDGAPVDDEDDACDLDLGSGIEATVYGAGELLLPPPEQRALVIPYICNATVTATEGTYEEELRCRGSGTDCDCTGAHDRPGTYSVTAVFGDRKETKIVTVGTDECGTVSESVDFFEE